MSDADLAAELAERAGALLLDLRRRSGLAGAELGAAGDRAANRLILEGLAETRPGEAVLSEESPDPLGRTTRPRVWIVDPLDGTREYSEGRDDWAVHVALSIDGAAAAGAVAVPARGHLFRSDAPPPPPARPERGRMLVSRTRPPAGAEALADALGLELIPMGSAGAKAMAVVAGEAEVYFHRGGQHEWDNCAPVAVALAAGLHASRVDGSPIRYNQADSLVPDLVIGVTELAARIVALLPELASSNRK